MFHVNSREASFPTTQMINKSQYPCMTDAIDQCNNHQSKLAHNKEIPYSSLLKTRNLLPDLSYKDHSNMFPLEDHDHIDQNHRTFQFPLQRFGLVEFSINEKQLIC